MPRISSGLVILAALWGLATPVRAQLLPNYLEKRTFEIPLVVAEPGKYSEFILYSSRDGKIYSAASTIPSNRKSFEFTAPEDGEYYFLIQSKNTFGVLDPPNLNGMVRPLLRVIVDTTMPKVVFRAIETKEGAAVEWEIEDPNLDLRTLTLEYRKAADGAWIPLRPKALDRAHFSWNPILEGNIDVRLSVADLAGNRTIKMVQAKAGPTKSRPGRVATPGTPRTIYVSSKLFKLKYNLQDVGESRVKHVELWLTRDTRAWSKHHLIEGDKLSKPIEISVETPGRYGFTLRPISGVGRAEPIPEIGQSPQIWVEVDTTKPVVKIKNVIVGEDADAGFMTVEFTAEDKFLRDKSVTVSTRRDDKGPWEVLQSDLSTSGILRLPTKDRGPQFYLKVEAMDEAGNRGEDVWPQPVSVDLSKPKASIVDIEVVPEKTPPDKAPSDKPPPPGGGPPGGGPPEGGPPGGGPPTEPPGEGTTLKVSPLSSAPPPPPPGVSSLPPS
jgi:hypothetical protein